MDLTSHQKELIRESFARVGRMGDVAFLTFCQQLFRMDASLRGFIRLESDTCRRHAMDAIRLAVDSLDQWDGVQPDLCSMGRRHARAGLLESQYDTVREALLETLKLNLGAAFTPELRQAWIRFFDGMAGTMKTAAADMRAGGYDTTLFHAGKPLTERAIDRPAL